jgi:hypothetical protein
LDRQAELKDLLFFFFFFFGLRPQAQRRVISCSLPEWSDLIEREINSPYTRHYRYYLRLSPVKSAGYRILFFDCVARNPPGLLSPVEKEVHSMAENKRQNNVGVKAPAQGPSTGASSPGMASAMVPLEVALSGAIGAR